MNNSEMPAMPGLKAYLPSGLTKREHFAAMAMAAMIANPEWETSSTVSSDAVFAADALLAELERTK